VRDADSDYAGIHFHLLQDMRPCVPGVLSSREARRDAWLPALQGP
jgi:hypothetical protein